MNHEYAALAELAGGFIHEIKNHLSTLGLNLQLLAEDFQDPQSQRERRALTRIQRLQEQCQHLADIANDFLRFARIKDLHRVPTDLSRVLEEMIDFFAPTAKAASIEIKSYLPADLPAVALDRDLFKQALLNLMLNAEQAMPGGGELTIQAVLEDVECGVRSAESQAQSAECEARNAERAKSGIPHSALGSPLSALRSPIVCLSLIDTGRGMPADVQAKIFQPFFSTKTTGSGLGLATTKRIIEAHGATIEVQSEVGRGTKFTIRLPVHQVTSSPESDVGTCKV